MIEWITYRSKAIAGFPMGDNPERSFPIYLPPDFSKKPKEPYPVFFLLAGFSGKGATYLTDDTVFNTPLQERFDRAIKAGKMKPFIAVFPDCCSKFGCSQYVNSPAFGNYMDYVCDELVAVIDERYPTHRSREFRGVAGHSSGGFGAMVIGMLRPDAFSTICSSAGDSFYEVNLIRNITVAMNEIHKAGGLPKFIEKFFSFNSAKTIPGSMFDTMLTLQMAACYAPNVKNPPLYGDLFFDLEDGAFKPEVFERYLEWDPLRMVDKHVSALKKLKYILLEAGLQDEHALQWGHRQIAKKLKRHGIPVEVNEYDGTHGGHHWRFESRLTKMLEAMYR